MMSKDEQIPFNNRTHDRLTELEKKLDVVLTENIMTTKYIQRAEKVVNAYQKAYENRGFRYKKRIEKLEASSAAHTEDWRRLRPFECFEILGNSLHNQEEVLREFFNGLINHYALEERRRRTDREWTSFYKDLLDKLRAGSARQTEQEHKIGITMATGTVQEPIEPEQDIMALRGWEQQNEIDRQSKIVREHEKEPTVHITIEDKLPQPTFIGDPVVVEKADLEDLVSYMENDEEKHDYDEPRGKEYRKKYLEET